MITLKPPFRAQDMEGLYNKVIKGQFSKIPDRFSSDFSEICKLLIRVEPESRPNCDQILKHTIIQNKIELLNKTSESELKDQLLQTIKIPKNLLLLTDRLPRPNYQNMNTLKKNQSYTKINSKEVNQKKRKSQGSVEGNENEETNLKRVRKVEEDKKKLREGIRSPKKIERSKSPLKSPNQYDYMNVKKIKAGSPTEEKKEKEKTILPNIHRHGSVDLRYEVNNKIMKYENEVNRLDRNLINQGNRIMNSVSPQGHQHVKEIYKVYAPYLKLNKNIIQKYMKNNQDKSYVKNLEKYYNFDNNPKIESKVILNRKLSPIQRKI